MTFWTEMLQEEDILKDALGLQRREQGGKHVSQRISGGSRQCSDLVQHKPSLSGPGVVQGALGASLTLKPDSEDTHEGFRTTTRRQMLEQVVIRLNGYVREVKGIIMCVLRGVRIHLFYVTHDNSKDTAYLKAFLSFGSSLVV